MTKRRPLALGAAVTIGFGSLFFASPALAENTDTKTDSEATVQETAPAAPEQAPADPAAPAEQAPAPAEEGTVPDEAPSAEETASVKEAGVEIVAYGVNAEGEPVVVTTEDSAEGAKAEAAIEAFAESQGIAAESDAVHEAKLPSAPVAYADGDVVAGAGYAGVSDGYLYACSIGFTAWTMTEAGRQPALIGAGHCGYDQNDAAISDTLLTVPSGEPAVGGEGYKVPENPVLLGQFGFAQFGGPGVNNPGASGDPNSTDISVIDVNTDGGWNTLPAVTDWTTAGDSLDSLAASVVEVKNVGAVQPGTQISKSGRTTGFTTSTVAPGDIDATTGTHIVDGWSTIGGRWVRGFSATLEAGPGDSGGSVIQGNTAVGVISGGDEETQWTWSTSLAHGLPLVDGEVEVALDIDAPTVASPAADATVAPGSDIVVNVPGNATQLQVSTSPNSGWAENVTNGQVVLQAPQEDGPVTYSLTAVNGMSWSESAQFSITVDASVVPQPPAAPEITSIADGDTFAHDRAPSTISGTGVEGATVTVTVGGKNYTATVVNGAWTVDLGAALPAGSHTITAVQTVGGLTSTADTVTVVVNAAPVTPTPPTTPGGNGGVTGGGNGLANTGAASMMPLGLAAVAMLLLGGAVTVVAARRQRKATEI